MLQNNETNQWYIRFFLGFSGWIGALFILLFLAFFVSYAGEASLPMLLLLSGSMLILLASIILVYEQGDFIEQFGLANILAGEGAVAVGLFALVDDNVALMVLTILLALLIWIIPHYLHRLIASMGMGISLLWYAHLAHSLEYAIALYSVVLFTLLLYRDKFKHSTKVEAIIYGLLLAFIAFNYADWFTPKHLIKEHTLIGLTLSTIVAFSTWKIVQSYALLKEVKVVSSALGAVCLSSLYALSIPNLMIPITILIIAFWQQDKKLLSLSILLGLFSLSRYYYFMGNSLLEKSQILLLSSLGFIIAYGVLQLLFKKDTHA
jgi:hypothetical protein